MDEEKNEVVVNENNDSLPVEKKKEKGLLAKSGHKAGAIVGRALSDFNSIQVPQSLNWFFSLGFKIGIFVIIKDYLVLRRQIGNLSTYGYAVVAGQFILAFIMIALGVILQNPVLYDQPGKMKKATLFYLVAGAANFGTYLYGKFNDAKFFIIQSVDPGFKGVLKNLFSGFREFSLSVLFADLDIWAVFALLMFAITEMYLYITCDELQIKRMMAEDSPELAEARKKSKVKKAAWALALCALIGLFAFGIPFVEKFNKIEIPYAASEFKSRTYGPTVMELKELGFRNFVLEADNSKNSDKIKYISINDMEDFKQGQLVSKNAEIHIIFYSKNVDDITCLLNSTKQIVIKNGMKPSSYTSQDEEIATVDENGVVTGLKEGKTVIAIQIEDVIYNCEVTVREKKWYDSFTESEANALLTIKESAQSAGQSILDFIRGNRDKSSDEESWLDKIKNKLGN